MSVSTALIAVFPFSSPGIPPTRVRCHAPLPASGNVWPSPPGRQPTPPCRRARPGWR